MEIDLIGFASSVLNDNYSDQTDFVKSHFAVVLRSDRL